MNQALILKVFIGDFGIMKSKIIEKLYRSEKFNEALRLLCKNGSNLDDLKHEIIMILFEKDEDFLLNLDNKNQLLYFTIGIIKKQYHSSTSKFYKDFRLRNLPIEEDLLKVKLEEDYDTKIIDKIEEYLVKDLHWFNSHIFTMYYFSKVDKEGRELKPLSYRKIQDAHRWHGMKLDYNKVGKIVKETTEIIKNKLEQDGWIKVDRNLPNSLVYRRISDFGSDFSVY